MKSHEQKFTEAIGALTFRLNSWGVEDPATKAREFVHALVEQGWRGSMPELDRPKPVPPAAPQTVEAAIAAARAALREATTVTTEGEPA